MKTASFDLSARDRLRIEGPDAPSFLNRLLTIDARRMEPGAGARTFLLDAKGRIDACFYLLRTGPESYLVECAAGHGAEVLGKLDIYHFGERIEFAPCDDLTVLSIQGPGAVDALSTAGVTPPEAPWAHHEAHLGGLAVRLVRVDRGGDGVDVWCSDPGAVRAALGLRVGDAAELEAMRVEAGVPAHPNEYGPHSSPLEVSGTSGVTEGKGCYPGQEVVERTLALGRPPRRLARLELDGPVAAGAGLLSGDDAVGTVTSASETEAGVVALALVKRRLDPETTLRTSDGVTGRERP